MVPNLYRFVRRTSLLQDGEINAGKMISQRVNYEKQATELATVTM